MPRGRPKKVKPEDVPVAEGSVDIVSVADVSTDDLASLKRHVADLEAKLRLSESARSDAEKKAIAQLEAQSAFPVSRVEEVPTGNKRKVNRFKEWEVKSWKDNGDPVRIPIFEVVSVDEYAYKIDLPPCGGLKMKVNGEDLFHGEVIKTDMQTLQTIKEMIYRCWRHDADIHGTDENFYRRSDPSWQSRNGTARSRGVL